MEFLDNEISRLRNAGLYRDLRKIKSVKPGQVQFVDGQWLLNFCSNDYLGLAFANPPTFAHVEPAGGGASRLLAGNFEIHDFLERSIATFIGCSSALLFSSGYSANCGALPALLGSEDAVFSDELNHSSMIDGMRLSRAKIFVYRHRDSAHLEQLLNENAGSFRRILIASEGIFSMHGTRVRLPDILSLARKHNALVYIDDAHGFGVLGSQGKGIFSSFAETFDEACVIYMGTLGKSLGAQGAFVAGSQRLREFLINRARTFIYSTGLSPMLAQRALSNLETVKKDPEPVRRLHENGELFIRLTKNWSEFKDRENVPLPIQPFCVGDVEKSLNIANQLEKKGFYVRAIRPPTVPEGQSRLRMTLSAAHQKNDIENLVHVLAEFRA